MLQTIAYIIPGGLLIRKLLNKTPIPPLFGMILFGIIAGPFLLDIFDENFLALSGEIRTAALIVILTRAGITLSFDDIRDSGLSVFFLSFVPALFEIGGTVILATKIFGLSVRDAALAGTVLAAVSPAVVVPKMIHIIEKDYGTGKKVPQSVLAAASVDDVTVIVLFTVFLTLAKGGDVQYVDFIFLPVSVITGIGAGIIIGKILDRFFHEFDTGGFYKMLILLSVSFLLVTFGGRIERYYAPLLSVMTMPMVMEKEKESFIELTSYYNDLWKVGEIFLFVLVGAAVDPSYLKEGGPVIVLFLAGILMFRMAGTYLALLPSSFNAREKLFVMISYMPKATVQAAIGAVPLSAGFSSGGIILSLAVSAILVTAPVGAVLIERFYPVLLEKNTKKSRKRAGL